MPYALRTWECPQCGEEHQRRAPAGSAPSCHPCRIKNAAEAARQMHAKAGPYYEQWLFRTGQWARRIARESLPVVTRRAGLRRVSRAAPQGFPWGVFACQRGFLL